MFQDVEHAALGRGEPQSVPSDLDDERLVRGAGMGGAVTAFGQWVRGGDLGSLPVVLGLGLISVVFYVQEPVFLSSRTW